MIALNIENCPHVAAIKAQPLTHDAAACRFEYSTIHAGFAQNHSGAPGSGHIAVQNTFAVKVNAVSRGHTCNKAAEFHNVPDHARCGRLTIGACDSTQGDACWLAFLEQ